MPLSCSMTTAPEYVHLHGAGVGAGTGPTTSTVLPIDVARVLPPGTEFVIARHGSPTDRLHVHIEGPIDGDIREQIVASTGVPTQIDWIPVGDLPRAAYKAQRVIDVAPA